MTTKRRDRLTTPKELAGGFLRALKARGAEVGVWEIRGRVFARVMVAARDAKLSGAETHVLSTIALHLQHLGRTKGMMTIGSLADDCMVEPRTVRNALRVLEAVKYVTVRYRPSGQMTVLLARRFGPRAPVPADQSADGSPRRSAPRKKISTNGYSMLSYPLTDECTDSAAPNGGRRESTGSQLRSRTAQRRRIQDATATVCFCRLIPKTVRGACAFCIERVNAAGHDPPRKRAP